MSEFKMASTIAYIHILLAWSWSRTCGLGLEIVVFPYITDNQ